MADRSRRVVWTHHALFSLDEVIGFSAADSPRAATDLLHRFIATASSLSTLSERGRSVPEIADPSIREMLVDRFRLLYQIRDHEVFVIAILHQARHLGCWKDGE